MTETTTDTTPAPQRAQNQSWWRSVNPSGTAVIVAWSLSILLHVLLFVIALQLVFQQTPPKKKGPVVTRAELIGDIDARPLSASPMPQLADPAHAQLPSEAPMVPRDVTSLADLGQQSKPDLSIIGIGAGSGDLSEYGLSGGGGQGPEFFGIGGSAKGVRRVIYVVDKSGSMQATFDAVREELKESISGLRRSQKFHVIFFSNDPPVENPPARLVPAIRAHKQRFYSFMYSDAVKASGGTHPEQAMLRAIKLEPDLIYFLTDGMFDPGLIDKLDRWNRDRRIRIYTIAYVDQSGRLLLEQIARAHDGEFRFVSEDDLP